MNPTRIVLDTGVGGDLVVSAPQVRLLDGGTVASRNFGAGTGGNLSVTAVDSIEASSHSPVRLRVAHKILQRVP